MRRVSVVSVLSYSVVAVMVAVFAPASFAQSALSNGGNHVAVLQVGGLDAWSVQANVNDSIVVSLGKVLGNGSDPSFYPWLRLKGPDGSLLRESYASYSDTNSVDIDQRVALAGTYTVLVASSNPTQATPASYVLTLAGPTGGFSVAGILAVAGSTPGNGAYFRTRVQIHNPRIT